MCPGNLEVFVFSRAVA
nr:unnamed protein product [Callosobruchus analis]